MWQWHPGRVVNSIYSMARMTTARFRQEATETSCSNAIACEWRDEVVRSSGDSVKVDIYRVDA